MCACFLIPVLFSAGHILMTIHFCCFGFILFSSFVPLVERRCTVLVERRCPEYYCYLAQVKIENEIYYVRICKANESKRFFDVQVYFNWWWSIKVGALYHKSKYYQNISKKLVKWVFEFHRNYLESLVAHESFEIMILPRWFD